MIFKQTPKNLSSNTEYKVVNAWHATYTLMKFCETHNMGLRLKKFEIILEHLEHVYFDRAKSVAATVPTGRTNGCFDDALVYPVLPSEDETSAQITFYALIAYWRNAFENPPFSRDSPYLEPNY